MGCITVPQNPLCQWDFHVHTTISVCARKQMTVENILERAACIGYTKLGLSDHVGQTGEQIDQILSLRDRFANQTGLACWLGCEIAPKEGGGFCQDEDTLARLDYCLVAPTHTIAPPDTETCSEQEVQIYLDSWLSLSRTCLDSILTDVIAHPLRGLGSYWRGRPLITYLDRDSLAEIFKLMAERNVAMELNDTIENHETAYYEYREFYGMAAEAGVRFSPASDAHGLDRLGFQVNWLRLAQDLGLGDDRFWSPEQARRLQKR